MELFRLQRRKHSTIRFRLYLIGAAILLGGLLSSAWIYLAATDEVNESDVFSYEIVNGHKYAVRKADSKRYRFEMERIGGKFSVMLDDFNQWLSSLLHGKRLAYTIALLAIAAALAIFWVAQHPDYNLPDNGNEGQHY